MYNLNSYQAGKVLDMFINMHWLTPSSYRLYETVYECESDKRYGRSPLFGYNYSVLLAGDISVGDTVYTK